MSNRAPQFLRSSPALGTGSYGALPVQHTSTSPSDSETDTPPRHTQSNQEYGQRHDRDPPLRSLVSERLLRRDVRSDPQDYGAINGGGHRKRHRSSGTRRPLLDEALEGQAESGLESRFNADGGISSIPGGVFEDLHSDSSTSGPKSPESRSCDEAIGISITDNDSDPPDNSPYAQVRASVPPTDDTSLSINTPRMWFLSIFFAILGSSSNLFFSLRYPSVSITPIIALLLSHPLGLLWDQLLRRHDDPHEMFVNGSLQAEEDASEAGSDTLINSNGNLSGSSESYHLAGHSWPRNFRLWLAQGRWNSKEHCCVFISSNVSFGFAFATDVIVEQTQFYGQTLGVDYQILLIISTQILGYAIAGLTRRFLVRPSGMIWPGTLISASMFSTLHKDENKPADGWLISRTRFFVWVFLGSVAFYFLPGLLMPALSYFSVVTWFAPKNVVVSNLFGVASGLGLFPMTFDWAQIAYIGSPLIVPAWAALNVCAGLVVVMWIIAPILYYCNVLYSGYMPILSSAVFDNTGKPYDVSKILGPDFIFDEKAYHEYSRVFLPITYVLSYALQFAALAALVTHTACWHGKDIWKQWRLSLKEIRTEDLRASKPLLDDYRYQNDEIRRINSRRSDTSSTEPGLTQIMGVQDVHNRLMRRYTDVPLLWYLITGISMTAVGIFVVEYYPIHLPWYGLLLALAICAILFIPIGIVMATTNTQSSIYLICQLACGVIFPGSGVGNMVFTTYSYITSTQGLKFASDMKLGHYMKIPPKTLFVLQLVATIISSLTQIGVLNWMLAKIPGICTPAAINGFTCPLARVHFNGSILWGVIGPARFFGQGALYRHLVWAFLVGAMTPIGVWLLGRRHRRSVWHKVNLPVVFGSLSWIPPATGLNFSVWGLVCWFFNEFVRNRRPGWWSKYTMTLSAALDSGLAVGVVIIFFGVLYPGYLKGFHWWGTEVYKRGCDWRACSYIGLGPGQTFGPEKW